MPMYEKLITLAHEAKTSESALKDLITYARELDCGVHNKIAKIYGVEDYKIDKASDIHDLISTGYPSIDKWAKFKKGGMNFVCAYTNHGKTMFLHNMVLEQIAYYAKIKKDFKVAFFNYEAINFETMIHLSYLYFIKRYDAGMYNGQKEVYRISFDSYYSESVKKDSVFYEIDNNIMHFLSKYIVVYDTDYTTEHIGIVIRKLLESDRKINEFIIDYINLVPCDKRFSNRYFEVKDVLMELKTIAKETHTTCISAAQYNQDKMLKNRTNIERIANVHEGKDINKIADIFMSLWNSTVFGIAEQGQDKPDNLQYVEISILKARGRQKMKKGITFLIDKEHASLREDKREPEHEQTGEDF